MLRVDNQVEVVCGLSPDAIPRNLLSATKPMLLRGLVDSWPMVKAAGQSLLAADRYLRGFYRDATVGVFIGDPDAEGRIFYNADMTGFNFAKAIVKLDAVLDRVRQHAHDAKPPTIYVGSTTVDVCLPGFRDANDVALGIDALASIWLGNRARIAAHFDVPHNLACCVAGRREFILFPPEELPNLYVGPLDFTPAGQAISLVDMARPDYAKHPRFRHALAKAQVAQLSPGDAIFIPSMWWHHVRSLDSLNVLLNYWWRDAPAYAGTPANVLNHALLGLRPLPKPQREAWQRIFEHYIFDADEETAAHVPEPARGILGTINDAMARQLRADLLNKLNR